MKFPNSKGFSLIEVLISASIIGALSVVIVNMNQTANKTIKTSESKSDILSIVNNIRTLLSDSNACNESFFNLKAKDSATINSLKDKDGNIKYQVNKKMGIIEIVSMKLSDSPPEVGVNTADLGDTYLIIKFSKGKQTFAYDTSKEIKIMVEVDTNNKIKTCHAGSAGPKQIWQRSISNSDDIFYNQGNVGIGDSNPNYKLLIKGQAKGSGIGIDKTIGIYPDGVGSTAGIVFGPNKAELDKETRTRDVAHIGVGTLDKHFGSHVNAWDLSIGARINKDIHFVTRGDADGDITTAEKHPSRMLIKSNGKVGIGILTPRSKLDVGGSVRLGNHKDPSDCIQGEIWFDYSTSKPMYCKNDGQPVVL